RSGPCLRPDRSFVARLSGARLAARERRLIEYANTYVRASTAGQGRRHRKQPGPRATCSRTPEGAWNDLGEPAGSAFRLEVLDGDDRPAVDFPPGGHGPARRRVGSSQRAL